MPKRGFYAGLALIAGGTLALEIMLTRVFSVIMWYHMSLVAVSMAMFGMTLGALIVHWRPESFSAEKAPAACSRHAAWFGVSVVVTLLVCVNTPFRIDASVAGMSLNSVFVILYWNAVAAIPFVFSGICVTVALTRFPERVGKLYATDLAGASIACIAVVFVLNRIDALSAIMLVGALALLASAAFSVDRRRSLSRLAFGAVVVVLAMSNARTHTIRIQYAADHYVGDEITRHDEWNAFSYIRVTQPKDGRYYNGLGDNHEKAPASPSKYLTLTMDTRAATPLTQFDGKTWEDIEWLRWDGTNVVHSLRDDGATLVIGVGGGRDVISALLPTRGTRKVTGVEINPITLSLLTDREKSYIGNFAALPNVRFYNDEARSWVARSSESFQVITIPLVDTSAASAAGAFALTENSLYTVEAFELFIDHLTDDGILSISRWWNGGNIGETHRLTAMGAAALRHKGASEPRKNLVLIRAGSLTTMLLSKRALSADDLRRLDDASAKYGFEELLTPTRGNPNVIASVEDPSWPSRAELSYVNVTPSTDDQPFFFHSYRMTNLFSLTDAPAGVAFFDRDAMVILIVLVLFVSLLAIAVVVVPFRIEQKKTGAALRREQVEATGFFAMIGFGFMLFESAQLQRLSIFLGYPIYALTVVLFGLLLSSSLGAWIAGNLYEKHGPRAVRIAAGGLLLAIFAIGIVTMPVVRAFSAATTPVRIVVAAMLVAPAGLSMGMLFPMGLRLVERVRGVSLPWCWAINGMASTCAAVYAIALSISFGFTAAYWSAAACYVLASAFGVRLAGRAHTDAGGAIGAPAAASA